jgi:hypothetical protein
MAFLRNSHHQSGHYSTPIDDTLASPWGLASKAVLVDALNGAAHCRSTNAKMSRCIGDTVASTDETSDLRTFVFREHF